MCVDVHRMRLPDEVTPQYTMRRETTEMLDGWRLQAMQTPAAKPCIRLLKQPNTPRAAKVSLCLLLAKSRCQVARSALGPERPLGMQPHPNLHQTTMPLTVAALRRDLPMLGSWAVSSRVWAAPLPSWSALPPCLSPSLPGCGRKTRPRGRP